MTRRAFFERVEKARRKVADRHPYKGIWFRGVKQGTFKCVPSFYRYNGLSELNLMARFRREGARYLQGNNNDWEILAFMQHYGVPTKLLDWTTDITSAIYFALVHNVGIDEKLEQPHVWVLNPFLLNQDRESYGKNVILDSMNPAPEYQPPKESKDTWPYKKPIALALNWYDQRIEYQQGVFTYHGTDRDPIDDESPWACRVEIKEKEIRDLIQHLKDAGVSHHKMFRSPDHLGMDIKESATKESILW